MPSLNQFLGRTTELKQLSDAWSQAKLGNPQWVAIVAETGIGKTRLVQEFYRQLAAAENASRRPAVGYWPDELPIDRDKLGLNPSIDSFSEGAIQSIAELPWLWWGLRGQRDIRNANGSGCAARDAKPDLELHYAAVIARKMKESAARRVGTEAVKVVSNVLGFGAVETFFSLFDPGSAAYEAVRALCTNDEVVIRAEKSKQSKKLQDQLAEVLAAFLDQQIPVILVLDDAQWLDADTIAFVSSLVVTQVPKRLKLMIVSTGWASDWHAAPIRDVYESFSESKSVIPLAVVDQETAKTFLLSKFPGLTRGDIKLILDRSEGNFLYLEEISIQLLANRWTYFVEGDKSRNLSETGYKKIRREKLDIEDLIISRFLKMERECQVALMQSSYQGRRFDPQLTARVGQMVFGPVEGDPNKTLEALKLAVKPGAMITEVQVCLREFLQGPYHRLIREMFDEWSDETSVRSAYQQLIDNSAIGVSDSIVEAVLVQLLEEMSDEADRIPLLARLLLIAMEGNRYQAGLGRLKQLASAYANLPSGADAVTPTVGPATTYAAVRLFGQYAFGAGDQADRQLLEEFCLDRASEDLQRPIFAFLHDGTIPTGCTLRQLVTWSEALVSLRQALGHIHDYFLWLGLLCQLKNRLLESGSAEPGAPLSYAASLLHYAEAQVPMAEDRSKWDALFEDFRTAQTSIDMLEGTERTVFQAWLQISVLCLGREGRPHYPEMQDWGDDYQAYCRAANQLGDVLCEIELAENSAAHSGLMGFSDDLLEALLHASTLTLEYALGAGHEIAVAFVDRSRFVSGEVFRRLDEGVYVPTSLGFHAMESNLAVVSMLNHLASPERQAAIPTQPAIPGFQMYALESREVGASEVTQMMPQIVSAVARYRELGMLSMGMVVTFARTSYDRLILTNAQTPEVLQAFNIVMDDAVLTREGERAAFGESVQLLQWLVRIYDKWLTETPEAEQLWIRLQEGYKPCEDWKFQALVGEIRSDTHHRRQR